MLLSAFAQLRFAASLLFGVRFAAWSLDRLAVAIRETVQEFGTLGTDSAEMLNGPVLDEATRCEMQSRRFRTQAVRAARETDYYGALFARSGVDLRRLGYDDIARLPVTPKEALRDDPDGFVRRGARPVYRTTTTGTTGRPTSVVFSAYEMHTFIALNAISQLQTGAVTPEDVVLISGKATIGPTCFGSACARIGAQVLLAGQIEPEETLALLRERRRIAGQREQVSLLSAHPSYLGALVECGTRLGLGPTDFGLRNVATGGEIVTAGLKRRCQVLFGPVRFGEGYGITETWPFGGMLCPDGHLHFEPSQGLMELLPLDADVSEGPATLVLTPFPPFRETTLLVRYNTEDVVRPITEPLACSLRHAPATSNILGKARLAVRHDQGWTFSREVLEALEALDEVPLPARCGFWAVPGGVAVEVVAADEGATRRAIRASLHDHGVPVQELYLRADRSELEQPFPLRGDLRETSFNPRRRAAHERCEAIHE